MFTARVAGNLLVALHGTVYLKVSNYYDNWDNGDGCGDRNDDSDNDDDDDDDVEVKYKDRSLLLRVLLIMKFIVILAMIFDADKNDDQNNL